MLQSRGDPKEKWLVQEAAVRSGTLNAMLDVELVVHLFAISSPMTTLWCRRYCGGWPVLPATQASAGKFQQLNNAVITSTTHRRDTRFLISAMKAMV